MSNATPTLPQTTRRWWREPFRLVQTNLRLIDARQDPREIARAVREFGGNSIVSNIGGIVAFYPTALQLQWINPYLQGDFAGEMIEAAHREGLAYIGRFDCSKAMRHAYDAHPDWFMLNRDGNPRVYAGTYQACPNGGWAQEYSFEILHEGLTRHEVDGTFFNMSGYPPLDYSAVAHGACVCANCERRFRDMYGMALPASDGFADPAWPQYLEFQKRTTAELADRCRALIRALRPAAGTTGHSVNDAMRRGETQRRVHRPAPEWVYQSGEQGRTAQAANPGQAAASTSTAHVDYPWRQVAETGPYHMLRFAQQLATGSSLDLYLMGTIADQNDPGYLEPISELYHWFAANADAYRGSRDAARIGLYDSASSKLWAGATRSDAKVQDAFRGAYAALVDARLPFDFVNEARVAAGEGELERFDAIILPAVVVLSDEEAAALDHYVEGGGLLIATGETGGYTRYGARRDAMPMRTSPVQRFGPPIDCHGWTFDGAAAPLGIGGRVPATGDYWPTAIHDDTEQLLDQAPLQPFGPPEFSFAEPDAPTLPHRGMLVRRSGRGVSIHLPWQPDWLYGRDGLPVLRRTLTAAIDTHAPPPPVRLEGPGAAELTVRRSGDGGLLIHVINYSGQRNTLYEEPAALHDLRLGVRGAVASGATSLVAKTPLTPADGDDGWSWFALPPVGYFEAVTLVTSTPPS